MERSLQVLLLEANMAKWWLGVALIAMGLVDSASAQDPYLPAQGRPVMPEPIPYYSSGPSADAPSPSMGGMQSDSPLALPGNLPNAWSKDEYNPAACYGTLGYLGLFRQSLSHGAAVALDTASGGIDTGAPPTAATPVIASFRDISPGYMNGVRATLGYHCDTSAFEVSGFYMSQSSSSTTFVAPGQLSTFFNIGGNFLNAPLGFEGDNGMWLQADLMRITFKQAVGSAEANYRWWLSHESDFSWSLGVRYLNVYERLGFFTGDDDLTVLDVNGHPDPTRQANYQVTTSNNIVAPQLGFQWEKTLGCHLGCYLAFNLTAKGAWGVDFSDVNVLLERGDGFVGFNTSRSDTHFSQLYEMGINLDIYLAERARLRVGYQMLWVVDVPTAVGQLDYDLSHTSGQVNNNGSIFYHGPMVELHVLF
jgi:hypothetical protein